MGDKKPSSEEGSATRNPEVERDGGQGTQKWRGMAAKEPRSGEGWGLRNPGVERDGGQGTQE